MDEPPVTWTPRRRGWMGPSRAGAPVSPPVSAEEAAQISAQAEAIIIVPPFPCFSPAAMAALLAVHRATVHNWIERGKVGCVRDNIGERYVMRDELIRFVREYLQRGVR